MQQTQPDFLQMLECSYRASLPRVEVQEGVL